MQSSILIHNTIPPHSMTNTHMRLLTEQELHDIYGGNIFTSIWNWLKKHFTMQVSNDPVNGPEITGTVTIRLGGQ